MIADVFEELLLLFIFGLEICLEYVTRFELLPKISELFIHIFQNEKFDGIFSKLTLVAC